MIFYQTWTILTGISILFLAYRTLRFARALKLLRDISIDPQRTQWPKVSLIVPACNEQNTIATAAQSLLQIDYPNLEIVFVNDRSSDNTSEIIRRVTKKDLRVKVIEITELPAGWLGKVNALNQGIAAATGEWILISDADVHYSATALKKAVVACENDQLDFLTVVPNVLSKGFGLKVIMAQVFHQGSLFIDLRKINHPKCRAAFGGGAFNMMKKTTYKNSEGLQWMRMEVVDDTGIALLMRRAGAKMGIIAGKHEIGIEWYPTLRAFIHGVEKNAFALCQYSLIPLAGFILVMIVAFLGITLAPVKSGSFWYAIWIITCLAIYMKSIKTQLNKMLQATLLTIFFLPIGSVILPFIFLRATILTLYRGGVRWRDTFYSLSELKSNQRMKFMEMFFTSNNK